MDFLIHPIKPADQSLLWSFLYLAVFVPEGAEAPDREIVHHPELSRYVQDWGQPGDIGFMARERSSGQPIGAAWLRLWSGEQKGYGYVSDSIPELSLAVIPEFRGRGIGSQLLDRLLSAASEQFPAVSLSVSAQNPALRLYRRAGFVEVRLEGGSWVMLKDLAPGSAGFIDRVLPGNAAVDGREFNSWFIGDLQTWHQDRQLPAAENKYHLRSSSQVEVKWGTHPRGQSRPGGWAQPSAKTALSLLVKGMFLLRFRDPSHPSHVVNQRLEREGDYVLWRETIEHSWLALEDSVVLTVRWVESD